MSTIGASPPTSDRRLFAQPRISDRYSITNDSQLDELARALGDHLPRDPH